MYQQQCRCLKEHQPCRCLHARIEDLRLLETNHGILRRPESNKAVSLRIVDGQETVSSLHSVLADQSGLQRSPSQLFYGHAKNYWSQIEPTNDGMLGGFANISWLDILGSENFLLDIMKLKPVMGTNRALDCGAGIGRVAKNLLMERFELVDLVEQDAHFLSQAKKSLENEKNLGELFLSGLQDFTPQEDTYDLIWCQWVLGHLTDLDLCEFLRRCSHALTRNGVIVMKENVICSEKSELDTTDSSFTRPLKLLKQLICAANLRIIKCTRQTNFPKELLPVYMIAMKPVKHKRKTCDE